MTKNKKTSNGLKNQPIKKNKSLASKKKMSNGKKGLIGGLVLLLGFSTFSFMSTNNDIITQSNIDDRSPVVFDSYVEGEDFFILSEKISDIETDDSKLNVAKFFWYGCPHCAALEPDTSRWSENNEDNVNMMYIHPALGDGWRGHARIYYALEKSNLVKYHKNVMRGARNDSAGFTDPEVVGDLMSDDEKQRFLNAYESDEIFDEISKANNIARKVGIEGVPSILIENQIITSLGQFSSPRELVRMLDSFKENRENLKTTIEEVTKKASSE